jgi:hypothetical protein
MYLTFNWKLIQPLVDSLPCMQEEDDFMLRRFLRARDHNIGKASAMFLKYLAWKLAQDKLYVQGHDKLGRPMVYLFGARHIAAKRDLNEFKRYVVYILDTTCTKYGSAYTNQLVEFHVWIM